MPNRTWDKFLTDEDRAALSARSERPRYQWGFGERPALLLIDLYQAVFGDRPETLLESMKRWPHSCGLAAWNALPFIQDLLEAARTAEIPVVHVTGLPMAMSGVQPWGEQGKANRVSVDKSSADLAAEITRYEIVEQVAPTAGEAVLRKTAPSAFWGTPLMAHLTANRIDTLLICGESTSGCVRATVVDARTNRFNVIVAEEGVFDRHEAPHAMNLFDMHQKYADVLPVDEVKQLLQDYVDARALSEDAVTA